QTAVCEVVGVVGSVRESIFGGETEPPHVYIPFGQQYQSDMQIHLKVAAGGPEAEKRMLEAIRHEIHSTDERLPLLTLTTMRRHLESSVEMWPHGRAHTRNLRRSGAVHREHRPLCHQRLHDGAADARDRHPNGFGRRCFVDAADDSERWASCHRDRNRYRFAASDWNRPTARRLFV